MAADDRDRRRWLTRYGQWAVVTGASDGIGRAVADRLAARGLNLLLVARRQPVLDALGAELVERYGVEVRVMPADLADEAVVASVVDATKALDVGLLVAAAGFGTSGALMDAPLDRELNMLDVNCRAVLALSHGFGRRFAGQGHGGIVLFGSLVGFQGVPRAANYAATKAYVQTLGEALHLELSPQGVDVLVAAPGPVNSGFAARADMRLGPALKPDTVAVATLNALGRRATVWPGPLSKLLIGSMAPLPRWARVRMMARIMGGITKHQHGGAKDDLKKPA